MPMNAPAAAKVKVLYHGRCFDGCASAATFTRFYRERISGGAEAAFAYQGMAHKQGEVFAPGDFSGDVNACVDFRYSRDPRLTWWFDHHVSGFPTPADERDFRERAAHDGRHFHDPDAKSCTRFLARVAEERYGFDPRPLKELIDWAELIDGALFPDAKTAVELEAPALKLMLLLEAAREPGLETRLIESFGAARPLAEIVAEPWARAPLDRVLAEHQRGIEAVRARARESGGVVFYDAADTGIETFNKFIPYYLYPAAAYTVAVSKGPGRAKVSVGSNPWAGALRAHNLAALCEKYGGGGHPAVGAVSLPPERLEDARRVAREIAATLGYRE
jgi:hypothetical protein